LVKCFHIHTRFANSCVTLEITVNDVDQGCTTFLPSLAALCLFLWITAASEFTLFIFFCTAAILLPHTELSLLPHFYLAVFMLSILIKHPQINISNITIVTTRDFYGVLGTWFGSLQLKIGSLESAKIVIRSLESDKIRCLESEKSGPCRYILRT